MIYDNVESIMRYKDVAGAFSEISELMESGKLGTLEAGTYYTESGVKYMIQCYDSRAEGRFELHDRFMDVQIVLSGTERIDMIKGSSDLPPSFDVDRDIGFTEDREGFGFVLGKGDFLAIFPRELHRPCMAVSTPLAVRKAVFKVPFPG